MKAQIYAVPWCKFSITLSPPLLFANDRSHPISLSSESTRDNHWGDNESVALVGIELSPAGGGIRSLSSSNLCLSKRQRMGRVRGSPFIPPHMQQMKLCTSDIPTNAVVGQCMDIAVTNFMHSHMSPFSLTECPKFLKLLKTAKSLGTGYLPPDQRKKSGPLLDDSSLEIDDEEDNSNDDDDTAYDFHHPVQVSLCASLIVNCLLNLFISFLVTKVTLICPSTREMD